MLELSDMQDDSIRLALACLTPAHDFLSSALLSRNRVEKLQDKYPFGDDD